MRFLGNPKIVPSLAKADAARVSMERSAVRRRHGQRVCKHTTVLSPHPFLSHLLEFRKQVSETEFIFWFEIKSVAAVIFQLAGMQGAGKTVLLLPWSRWGGEEGQCPRQPVRAMMIKRKGKKMTVNMNVF